MLNKIARHYGGHPFEKRYACLTELQIVILYRQAFLNEKESVDNTVKGYIEPLFKAWSDLMNDFTERISMFSNPELFKSYKELLEQKKYVEEVEEEDLTKVLFETLEAVPIMVEVPNEEDQIPTMEEDPELSKLMTGWIEDTDDIIKKLRE